MHEQGFPLWLLWLVSMFSALVVVVGRLGRSLFGLAGDPPSDPLALDHWGRRRRWLAYSELSAVPAFATISVAATIHFKLSVAACVGVSMILGAVGFGMLLDAAVYLFRKRIGVPADERA